jgi:hypothetical protein
MSVSKGVRRELNLFPFFGGLHLKVETVQHTHRLKPFYLIFKEMVDNGTA